MSRLSLPVQADPAGARTLPDERIEKVAAGGGAGLVITEERSKQHRRLCVISPCYNEDAVVEMFYMELKAVLESIPDLEYEIVFVDDGSSDQTLEQLNRLAIADANVAVLSLSRNFGHQIALTAGLDYARSSAVLLMDSDLQHPPSLIPQMVSLWRDGGYDIVSAVRNRTADAALFKRLTSDCFYKILNLLSDTTIEPGAADFCILSKRARRALVRMPERHRFLRGLIAWLGFPRVFVPYEAAARAAGTSKYNLRKMLRLALDATFSFSVAPIRIGIRVGLPFVVAGSFYLAYTVLRSMLGGGLVQGWASLISVTLILGGLQFIMIGLVGEYVGRIFEEVKSRPVYFLKQKLPVRRARTVE